MKLLSTKKAMAMCKKANHVCFYLPKGIIDVISKKWALLIVNSLGNCGTLRFNKFMKALKGISSKTLSDTLKELQTEGLIRRASFAEMPPQVEYLLTNDGTELRKSIIPLLEWTAKRDNMNNE